MIFEYCSRKGFPTDDITRVDEAPREACANGSAAWAHLFTSGLSSQSGDAYMNFGFVRVTPVIGFRFRYVGGNAIADGVSEHKDMTFHP